MHLQILADRDPQPVELVFGSEKDLVLVSRWRAPLHILPTSE